MAAPQRPLDEHLSSSTEGNKKLKNALLISAHEERASDEKKNRTRDKMSGNTDVEKGNFAVKAGLAQVRDSHRKELARFSSARARFFFFGFSFLSRRRRHRLSCVTSLFAFSLKLLFFSHSVRRQKTWR